MFKKKKHPKESERQELKTADYWCKKAEAAGDEKNFDEAIKSFDEALELVPSVHAWNGKGAALCEKRQFDKALDCFINALKLDPNNEYPLTLCLQIADTFFHRGSFGDAKNAFDRVREIEPENEINQRYWWDKYNESYEKQDYNKAKIARQYLFATYPQSPYTIRYWLKIADSLFDKNHFGASKKAFNEAWKIDSTNEKNKRYWQTKFIESHNKNDQIKARQAYEFAKIYCPTIVNLNGSQLSNDDGLSQNYTQSTSSKTPSPSSSSKHSASFFKPACMKSSENTPVSPDTISSQDRKDVHKNISSVPKVPKTSFIPDSIKHCHTFKTHRFLKKPRKFSLPETIVPQKSTHKTPSNRRNSSP